MRRSGSRETRFGLGAFPLWAGISCTLGCWKETHFHCTFKGFNTIEYNREFFQSNSARKKIKAIAGDPDIQFFVSAVVSIPDYRKPDMDNLL